MEFTLKSIQDAHKMYTGPDFPLLIKAFKSMGMITNIFDLETGLVTYVNSTGEIIQSEGVKLDFQIKDIGNVEEAQVALLNNQTGETDFYTFCRQIGQAGVCKWISNLEEMTCTYYDKDETIILHEVIPSVL